MTDLAELDRIEALQQRYVELEGQLAAAEVEAAALDLLSRSDAFPFDRYRLAMENCTSLQHNLNELIDNIQLLIGEEYP